MWWGALSAHLVSGASLSAEVPLALALMLFLLLSWAESVRCRREALSVQTSSADRHTAVSEVVRMKGKSLECWPSSSTFA